MIRPSASLLLVVDTAVLIDDLRDQPQAVAYAKA
jgi:hypothetical protein